MFKELTLSIHNTDKEEAVVIFQSKLEMKIKLKINWILKQGQRQI